MKKKSEILFHVFITCVLFSMLANSCKKDDLSVKDGDGNAYNTVTIGTQIWLGENLKTTKYNDKTEIPLVTDDTEWEGLTTPGYCWYNNNSSYKNTYGALYNWYVVNTGKLCPSGWHVPSNTEWTALEDYLIANGFNYDGSATGNKIAKSLASASGWQISMETGAPGNTDFPDYRNKSGFKAVPGGYRYEDGSFRLLGIACEGWTSSSYNTDRGWQYDIDKDYSGEILGHCEKMDGLTVRCLKD